MNEFEEKRFEDAVKQAAAAPDLAFYEELDPQVPPASEFTATAAAAAAPQPSRTEKRRRRTLYSLASLAACVCIVFAVLTANNAGMSGGNSGSAADSAAMAPAPAPGDTGKAGWDTAGEGYKNLYGKIEAYLGDMYADMGAIPAAEAPAPGAAPSASADDIDMNENAVMGGGYQNSEDAVPTEPIPDDAAGSPGGPAKSPEFSDTNEQTEGVREADIVKTDGSYIYAVNSKNLFIVKAGGSEMSLASKIPQPTVDDGQVYFEMYVADGRLIAIRHGYNAVALGNNFNNKQTCIEYPVGGYFTDTSVDIYDISDKTAPVLLHSLSQSGDYRDSRMIDGILYLITNYYYSDFSHIDPDDPRTYVPLYAADGEQLTPAPDDIILPRGDTWPAYTMVSGIDAAGSGGFVSQKSVYGESGTVYSSPEAIYFARAEYSTEELPYGEFTKYTSKTETILTKAALHEGDVEVVASASVPGVVSDQFALDEYGGVLRLVTTDDRSSWYNFQNPLGPASASDWDRLPPGASDTSNALYTLDASLNILGRLENLAPGERVFSCRFMTETAYFVTFRQTDLLFSVDLSDPAAPVVLGVLKIPGFSEYLHPYSKGELFGLGRDADAETGRQKGIKLSMFDNSDPADVKETQTLLVEYEDVYSTAETNHKAILVDAGKGIVAFPIQQWTDAGQESRYLIYSYDAQTGFSKAAEIGIDTGSSNWAEIRGLFIGDTFYVVGPNQVGAYDMKDGFAEKQILLIDEDADSVDRYGYYPPGIIVPFAEPSETVLID
ncbi:MAG: beta-propeller domain-containing protein [Clostridiales Family XIII bacterium]|jgi:uncharacterized secreted protein with C-terminal beta-propeller domain|nr:beta-propeller domain-containing protein [Clostridiales Family XIII bacterium]